MSHSHHPLVASARLDFAEALFISGRFIDGGTFLSLCHRQGIDIDDTTEYLIQTFIVCIRCDGHLQFVRPDGIKKYRLDKCHAIAKRLFEHYKTKTQ